MLHLSEHFQLALAEKRVYNSSRSEVKEGMGE